MCDLGPLNPAAAVEEREKRERTQLKSLSHILSSHAPFRKLSFLLLSLTFPRPASEFNFCARPSPSLALPRLALCQRKVAKLVAARRGKQQMEAGRAGERGG